LLSKSREFPRASMIASLFYAWACVGSDI